MPLLKDLGVLSSTAGDDEADELLAEIEMAEIDADGNGTCDFEELCEWWAKSGRGKPPVRPDVAAAQALTRRLEAQYLHDT